MKSKIDWFCKNFLNLSVQEFHDIVALREAVFVVEQNCVYLDVDGKDSKSLHVFGVLDNEVVAYLRIVSAGISYPEISIGRVVISMKLRGKKVGYELMQQGIDYIEGIFGEVPLRISAQEHLQNYYCSFGFKKVSETYLEDGIPHVEMLLEVVN